MYYDGVLIWGIEPISYTPTPTDTYTPVPTITQTGTISETSTITESITETNTETITDTQTPVYTFTFTDTATETITCTFTPTLTYTQTITQTITSSTTPTNTQSITQTITPTLTQIITPSITQTVTLAIGTYTFTPTITPTATVSDEYSDGTMVRNISVSEGCYWPGQQITVNFEVSANNAWQNVYGDIVFSIDNTPEYTDDAVWTSEGAKNPPDTNGHDGGFYVAQGSNASTWHPISKVVTVPSSYSGKYYVLVNVAENYLQLHSWGSHIESTAYRSMNGCIGSSSVKGIFTPERYEEISYLNTYNYPNPCSDSTTIRFSLDKAQEVSVVVYSVNGKEIFRKDLSAREMNGGINKVVWDLTNKSGLSVANGIYIYKIITADKTITKKIAVIK